MPKAEPTDEEQEEKLVWARERSTPSKERTLGKSRYAEICLCAENEFHRPRISEGTHLVKG